MKNLHNIFTKLIIVPIILLFACQQTGQITNPIENSVVTINNHGEILSRGVVKAEISMVVPDGTIYQCSCGEWHNAEGGENLYSQNSCNNQNGLTYSIHLKAKSAATFETESQISLSQIQEMVIYVDGAGVSHTVTSNQNVNAVKVLTGNAGSVWIGSSATIKIGEDEDELGEQ